MNAAESIDQTLQRLVSSEVSPWVEPFFIVWFACLGLVVGSFLNVVIVRLPNDESVVKPRSRCVGCGYMLSWYDNIPLFSWLFLRGKCRRCRMAISWRYPMVELLTAMLFLACYARFGLSYSLFVGAILIGFLVPLIFIDAEHFILPLEVTLSGLAVGLLLAWPRGSVHFADALLGAAIGFMAFRCIEYFGWKAFRQEAMGAGDKFLMAMVGAFLTYRAFMGVLLLSSVQASIYGLGMRAWLKFRGEELPSSQSTESPDMPVAEPTLTWAFDAPGLRWWQRVMRFPYAVFLQPIPDDPPWVEEDVSSAEEWTPGPSHIPFGPFIGLAAIELLLLADWLGSIFPSLRALGIFFG